MRLKPLGLTRRGLLLAAALLTALPATLPAPAVAAPRPASLPHPVGGLLPAGPRKVAPTGGVRALDVLPASVDLRADAPSPGDQGQIGACVTWTVGYSIMGYWANKTGGAGAPYAPLYLYQRNVAKGGAPTAGLIADYVLANVRSEGIDTQDDYWQGTTNWQQPPTQAQIDNARNYKVSGYARLFNGANQGAGAQTAIMQSLASGNPVALGLPVYRDFMYLRTHSLYATTSGANLGGHMVAAYGYDSQGVWIRNSWGTGWGNGGDAKLSWSFITRQATSAFSVSGITTPAEPVVPAPSVAALSTVKAAAGTQVTITGSSLATATSVTFGGTEAEFAPVVTGGITRLRATAPARAVGQVDVTVTNPSGTSLAVKTSKFTYIPPPPGITRLDPATVTVLGGQTVTVAGSSLAGVTTVKIGTLTAPARSVTAASLTFVTPIRPAGTYPVTVTNSWGTSTPAGQITYVNPPAPVIATLAPATALTYKTTPVVLTGTDLAGATKMTLDGRPISFTKISGTQVKLTLPKHAEGDAALQITTPGGTSTPATFTYEAPPAPVITDVTPPAGLTYVRTPIVLTGTGFTDSTRVTSAGATVPYTKLSDTQLKLTLPIRTAGPVSLQITTPGGTSAPATFTYEAPPLPVITAPLTGATRSSTAVTLTGTGLTGATRVLLGTTPIAFTKISDTQLKLTLPPRPAGTTTSLTVTTPGGTSTGVTVTY